MKTILVTGFGPFRDHDVNASWEAVKLLPDKIDMYEIVKKEIPVQYEIVKKKIPELWAKLKPELVIHVGVSSYTSDLKLETQAHRTGYTALDCTQKIPCSQSVCHSGDDCILTGFNVEKLCEEVNETGIVKASQSNYAGGYLCEFTYYISLSINREKVLFIHVPRLDQPYSVQELSNGLLCVIKKILDNQEIGER